MSANGDDQQKEEWEFIQENFPLWKGVDRQTVDFHLFPFGLSRAVSRVSTTRFVSTFYIYFYRNRSLAERALISCYSLNQWIGLD